MVDVARINKFYGWIGRVLDVDLTNGKISYRNLDEVCPEYKDYIGGRGLGVKILFNEVDQDTDPLGHENVLIFSTGPLTGTSVSGSGRYCVVTKSPLAQPKSPRAQGKSGAIVDAHSGGDWSDELKHTGFDLIIVRGRSEKPVYLWVNDGEAEIRDARNIWGNRTYDTTAAIKVELEDPYVKVACIGPAGEGLVRVACIINDADYKGHGRAAGRGGVGAVMGSKNLKAIAVRGTLDLEIARRGEFARAVRDISVKLREDAVCGTDLPLYGTEVLYNIINENGLLPTCNFQWGMLKEANLTSGEALVGEVAETPKTITRTEGCCRTCLMRCGRVTEIPEEIRPSYVTIGEGEGPEYETTWAFGAMCGVADIAPIAEANYLCNDLGLDTISTGSTIGCAMELCKRGYMGLPGYTSGEDPFSDGELVVRLVMMIAHKEGVGAELAEGSYNLAANHGHPELSMSVKALELPAYDPRGVLAHGLAYATSNRGGCHVRAYLIGAEVMGHYFGLESPDIDEATDEFRLSKNSHKTDLVLAFQNTFAAIDSLDQCLFTVFGIGPDEYAMVLSAVTGINYSADDFLKVGERVWNLEKLFNIREGFKKDDDRLPPRLESEPMPSEVYSAREKRALTLPVEVPPHGMIEEQPSSGSVVPIPEMLPIYYEKRGWTPEGTPTGEKLKELGLEWAKVKP
jgi:aldehyde:ferredoxin oxidoreductase